MIFKILTQSYKFSLLTKIPKTIKPPQQPKSWFSKLFTKNQDSATYILLKQLFTYLQGTNIFLKQFPYMKNTQRMQQNNMILHVHLLRERIKQQQQLPRSQLQKYQYNLQTHYFPDYAGFVNTAIPTQNFREHYSQAYMNKLQLFSEMINQHQWNINPNKQSIASEEYSLLFRKLLYENRVPVGHVELLKYCKYYLAHKKYLNMLEWNDMINYKVKWGLQSLKFIGEVDNIDNSTTNKRNNK